MERLTQRYGNDVLIAAHIEEKYTAEQLIDILAARLAEYEDLSLDPKELWMLIENPDIQKSLTKVSEYLAENMPTIVQGIVELIPAAAEKLLREHAKAKAIDA